MQMGREETLCYYAEAGRALNLICEIRAIADLDSENQSSLKLLFSHIC